MKKVFKTIIVCLTVYFIVLTLASMDYKSFSINIFYFIELEAKK